MKKLSVILILGTILCLEAAPTLAGESGKSIASQKVVVSRIIQPSSFTHQVIKR